MTWQKVTAAYRRTFDCGINAYRDRRISSGSDAHSWVHETNTGTFVKLRYHCRSCTHSTKIGAINKKWSYEVNLPNWKRQAPVDAILLGSVLPVAAEASPSPVSSPSPSTQEHPHFTPDNIRWWLACGVFSKTNAANGLAGCIAEWRRVVVVVTAAAALTAATLLRWRRPASNRLTWR